MAAVLADRGDTRAGVPRRRRPGRADHHDHVERLGGRRRRGDRAAARPGRLGIARGGAGGAARRRPRCTTPRWCATCWPAARGPVRDAVLLNAAAAIAAYDGRERGRPCTTRSPPACARRPTRSTAGAARPAGPLDRGGSQARPPAEQREPLDTGRVRRRRTARVPRAGLRGLGGRGGGRSPASGVAVAHYLSGQRTSACAGMHARRRRADPRRAAARTARCSARRCSPRGSWTRSPSRCSCCLAAAYLTGVALVPVRTPGARWPLARHACVPRRARGHAGSRRTAASRSTTRCCSPRTWPGTWRW